MSVKSRDAARLCRRVARRMPGVRVTAVSVGGDVEITAAYDVDGWFFRSLRAAMPRAEILRCVGSSALVRPARFVDRSPDRW